MKKWFYSYRRWYKAILLFVIIHGINPIHSQTYFTSLEDTLIASPWINAFIGDTGGGHSGSQYAYTDAVHPFGLGFDLSFPEQLAGQNTKLYLQVWIKSSSLHADASFVITIEEAGKSIFWKGTSIAPLLSATNTWVMFSDSLLVPASYTGRGKLKAYLWNNGSDFIAIDDLSFSLTPHQHPSFLPKSVALPPSSKKKKNNATLFANEFYSLQYEASDKTLQLKSPEGNMITRDFLYITEKTRGDNPIITTSKWQYKGSQTKKGLTSFRFKSTDQLEKTLLILTCKQGTPEIQLSTTSTFKRRQHVQRAALLMEMEAPLSEVCRSNRQSDTAHFQHEYWLDKEGVRFGDGINSLFLYHTPAISSLQVDGSSNLLYINLDYDKDHPFFRFPLMPDSSNWKVEQSFSFHKWRDQRTQSFSIYVGSKAPHLARFMKNPYGFEATYIWTEHADFTDIRTNRATYFGSEEITQADRAIGGFVFHHIPVTKSVFYDNPDLVNNTAASQGLFHSLESSIKTDTAFASFLKDIHRQGNDICLHTPEHFTTTPDRLETALSDMQSQFGSPSWIDHGYDNKLSSNRENLMCDGSLKKSPYFAIDQWKKHGIHYLWNGYYEDEASFLDWQFNSSIEKPSRDYGDFLPKPDFFQHQTQTNSLYHWSTSSALFIHTPDLWNYLFSRDKLGHFIDNWAVEINHCYPAWTDPKKGFWTFNADSVMVAQEGFNHTLKLMSEFRDLGKLNVCTLSDFLDYRLSIEMMDYQVLPDGRIKVTNHSKQPVYGLSMAAKATYVLVDDLKPLQKRSGHDLIFWFDVGVGESKIIRLID